MPRPIKLPNGQIAEFPDSMSLDQIKSAIEKKFPSPNKIPEKNTSIGMGDTIKQGLKYYINSSPANQAIAGFGQGIANIGPGLANLGIKGVNALTDLNVPEYKGFHFAPDTIPSNIGEIASYFAGPGIVKGASSIPLIAKSISHAREALGSIPKLSKVVNALTVPATGAVQGAVYNPEHQGVGAAAGAGGNILGKLMGTSNPIVSGLARTLLGGGAGYALGGVPGAEIGAGAALSAPFIGKKLAPVGYEFLKGQSPEIAQAHLEKSRRLGTSARPSEIFDDPFLAQMEGTLANTHEGSKLMIQKGKSRLKEQENAIKELFKEVSENPRLAGREVRDASKNAIREMENIRNETVENLYKLSHKKRVDPTKVTQLERSDKTIQNAIDSVMNDPAYSVELQGYPRNSIKVLDYTKRKIDTMISEAIRKEDFDKARVLNDSKNRLVQATDRFSKQYKKARKTYEEMSKPIEEAKNSQMGTVARIKDVNVHKVPQRIFDPNQTDINVLKNIKEQIMKKNPESWNALVRNEMERLMKGKRRGTDFYKNVLQNNNLFEQFKEALSHKPKAVQTLEDIRSTWNNLINPKTPRTSAGQSEAGMSWARESMQKIINKFIDLTGIGSKGIREKIEFIHNPNLDKEFEKVFKYEKDKERRSKAFSDIIAKVVPGIATARLSQGSDKYGSDVRTGSEP